MSNNITRTARTATQTLILAVIAAFGLTSAIQAANLTAYYDFEGVGPDQFDDPAGAFADNLNLQFNPAFSAVTPGAFAGTQSASFNGNSVLGTDAYSTDLGPDPNAFTVMFWIKGTDTSQENNNTRLLSTRRLPDGTSAGAIPNWQVEGFGNNGSNGDNMDMRANNGIGDLLFTPDAKSGTIGALANTGQTEVWHHVAFVWANSGDPGDGGAFAETFFDGNSVGISSEGATWDGFNIANPNGQFLIGGDAENAGSRAFTGLLDDVALFAGIVTDGDILAIAQGTLSPADFLPTVGGPAIPEPATATLLAVALVGLCFLRRRRR